MTKKKSPPKKKSGYENSIPLKGVDSNDPQMQVKSAAQQVMNSRAGLDRMLSYLIRHVPSIQHIDQVLEDLRVEIVRYNELLDNYQKLNDETESL